MFDPEDDCQDGGGHAVAIIGYGTDQKSGKDYWIIRNSWGVSWGDGGNFKIRRGINRCNIEYYAAYLWL